MGAGIKRGRERDKRRPRENQERIKSGAREGKAELTGLHSSEKLGEGKGCPLG